VDLGIKRDGKAIRIPQSTIVFPPYICEDSSLEALFRDPEDLLLPTETTEEIEPFLDRPRCSGGESSDGVPEDPTSFPLFVAFDLREETEPARDRVSFCGFFPFELLESFDEDRGLGDTGGSLTST
jgi:hypothetical protein